MAVEIRRVITKADRKKFVRFPEILYKDSKYQVPNLVIDELSTLNPAKNPASEFCNFELYLAYKDGVLAGRVAAIINWKANKYWNHKQVRFGWFDFVDDQEVSYALMEKVVEFGRKHDMDSVVGPLGFTDFDPEGMLVEGYDKLSTMALIYNHEYYPRHMEAMGFEKDADWIEYKVIIPEAFPERLTRLNEVLRERMNLHTVKLSRSLVSRKNYGRRIFNLINECYKNLYNFTILPDRMADKYLGLYLNIINLKFVSVVEDENDELVAFGITMPSLARALQKCRGNLFPFGWVHLLKAMYSKHIEGVEMLLIGVRPDYQNSGIATFMFMDIFKTCIEAGVKWAETNAMLETNLKIQGQWKDFEKETGKRRRSYIRQIK